jgi:hypothetical protein
LRGGRGSKTEHSSSCGCRDHGYALAIRHLHPSVVGTPAGAACRGRD